MASTIDSESAEAVGRLTPERPRSAAVEKLDEMIVVTKPRAWVGLVALAVVVVGLVVWAFTASIRDTTKAPVVALTNGSIATATANAEGVITSMGTARGDDVVAGEVAATITAIDGTTHDVLVPTNGSIVATIRTTGDFVTPGDEILVIEPTQGSLVLRSFPGIVEGQQIVAGDEVIVLLDAFGGAAGPQLEGTVTSVNPHPLARPEVAALLNDDALATYVMPPQATTVIEVTMQLDAASQAKVDALAQQYSDDGVLRAATGEATFILGTRHPIQFF